MHGQLVGRFVQCSLFDLDFGDSLLGLGQGATEHFSVLEQVFEDGLGLGVAHANWSLL